MLLRRNHGMVSSGRLDAGDIIHIDEADNSERNIFASCQNV
jgi:hypothetical protein